jgi:hypothetical protein
MRRTTADMEPLELLRAKIANFPGYGDDLELRRSDEYVRSYLGEALAELPIRAQLPAALQQRVEELLLRAGFENPRDFAAHYLAGAKMKPGASEAIAAADAATVALADRAASVDLASAPAYLDAVAAALDARDAAMRAAAAP